MRENSLLIRDSICNSLLILQVAAGRVVVEGGESAGQAGVILEAAVGRSGGIC